MSDPVILDSTPVERDGRVVYEADQAASAPAASPGPIQRLKRAALLAVGGTLVLAFGLLALVVSLPLMLLALLTGRPRRGDLVKMVVWRFGRGGGR